MIIIPLENGYYLIKSYRDGHALSIKNQRHCAFKSYEKTRQNLLNQDADSSYFWWDIECKNGHYFFISVCEIESYKGNVL